MKISINQKECIGCSFCTDCTPEIFEVDQKYFKCKIKKEGELIDSAPIELSAEQLKKVKEAAEGCPVKAIELSE